MFSQCHGAVFGSHNLLKNIPHSCSTSNVIKNLRSIKNLGIFNRVLKSTDFTGLLHRIIKHMGRAKEDRFDAN